MNIILSLSPSPEDRSQKGKILLVLLVFQAVPIARIEW
jgi:hypothetical protein